MQVELKFGPQVIRSYKRLPYTAWYALAEFVDNSTQSFMDHRHTLEPVYQEEGYGLEVSIVYEKKDTAFVRIADNAMGMNLQELQRSLYVGWAPDNTKGRSEFGLGMKTAACWLGNQWTLRTKRLGDEVEYEVTVDVEAVADGTAGLDLTSRTGRDPREHYTIIEITDLNHKFQTRTLGKIRQYLSSVYRHDLRTNQLLLEWQGAPLVWDDHALSDFLADHDGRPYKKDFRFTVNGKDVSGWVGVLKKGSRTKAGFSIMRRERVIRGWPESWRPEALYGQLEGSNDLVNQRLVGEIHLDDFEVSHTKSDILWMGDDEEKVEEKLRKIAWPLRETARTHRSRAADDRGPSSRDVSVAVDELNAELNSTEMVDAVSLEVVPPPEVVSSVVDSFLKSVGVREPTFRGSAGGLVVKGYLVDDASPNDPYIVLDSSDPGEVIIVVNARHPHFAYLEGSAGVLNFLRHCVYDGIAEWQARHKAGRIDPETIKMLKDALLRVPVEIEMHQAESDSADPGT